MAERRDIADYVLDAFGRQTPVDDTTGMMFPYRCLRCGHVHDASKVEVLARYTDCSVWACPHCQAHIDDRPIGWGGSAERVDQRNRRRRLR